MGDGRIGRLWDDAYGVSEALVALLARRWIGRVRTIYIS